MNTSAVESKFLAKPDELGIVAVGFSGGQVSKQTPSRRRWLLGLLGGRAAVRRADRRRDNPCSRSRSLPLHLTGAPPCARAPPRQLQSGGGGHHPTSTRAVNQC